MDSWQLTLPPPCCSQLSHPACPGASRQLSQSSMGTTGPMGRQQQLGLVTSRDTQPGSGENGVEEHHGDQTAMRNFDAAPRHTLTDKLRRGDGIHGNQTCTLERGMLMIFLMCIWWRAITARMDNKDIFITLLMISALLFSYLDFKRAWATCYV